MILKTDAFLINVKNALIIWDVAKCSINTRFLQLSSLSPGKVTWIVLKDIPSFIYKLWKGSWLDILCWLRMKSWHSREIN